MKINFTENSFREDHTTFLQSLNIDKEKLPLSLKNLINSYEKACEEYLKADKSTQDKLIGILVQTSAVIAAEILQNQPIQNEKKLQKQRLLELEAKALALEFKNRNEDDKHD